LRKLGKKAEKKVKIEKLPPGIARGAIETYVERHIDPFFLFSLRHAFSKSKHRKKK